MDSRTRNWIMRVALVAALFVSYWMGFRAGKEELRRVSIADTMSTPEEAPGQAAVHPTVQPIAAANPDTIAKSALIASERRVSSNEDDQGTSKAASLWKRLRDDDDKLIGTPIKNWRMNVISVPSTDFAGVLTWLDGNEYYECVLWTKDGEFSAASIAGQQDGFPKLHNDDWLIVDGEFRGVDEEGHENIYCSKVTRTKRTR